jgi:hypothetical protein
MSRETEKRVIVKIGKMTKGANHGLEVFRAHGSVTLRELQREAPAHQPLRAGRAWDGSPRAWEAPQGGRRSCLQHLKTQPPPGGMSAPTTLT